MSSPTSPELHSLPRIARCGALAETTGESPSDTARRLALTHELPWLPSPVADDAAKLPARLAQEYAAAPVKLEGTAPDELALATSWPPEPAMDSWIFAATGLRARWHLTAPETVVALLEKLYGVGAGSLDERDAGEEAESAAGEPEDEEAAVIRFVNEVIAKASAERATDIHVESKKDALLIRHRIDGELVTVATPANLAKHRAAVVSRLKIMARLNIAERRRPQDGRIRYKQGSTEIDIRVSTLPTLHGESVSLRLLGENTRPIPLAELGLPHEERALLERQLARPHGIILVTGPTGSGKSTTLAACLRAVARPELRLMTVEDPVEYEIAEANQTQVHAEIGLNFAAVLRSVLRQDPDVIMVGEIRDRETADIAIRASLTGHLVLSTLHTNDAAGAVTRLTDMGVEPFLIASSVELVIAQRLVRRLCRSCLTPANIEPLALEAAARELGVTDLSGASGIMHGAGCDRCRKTGYKGRVGVFEFLPVNESLHRLIVARQSARELRRQAREDGMRTLQQCAWLQTTRGLTGLQEALANAMGEEE